MILLARTEAVPMATKIHINNLRKVYDTPERRVHALENINLDVEDG